MRAPGGIYTQEGFVVYQGSTARRQMAAGLVGTAIGVNLEARRQALIKSGVIREAGDSYVFLKDHLFRSPSAAAFVLLGRSSNGWLEWKNSAGRTLDAVKRQTGV